ncbi:MAG: protein kinase [Candidatus Riflebacteria bacterium]|nr:protein kinase [Candidatus Riflebacteria bacterium]
MSLLCPDCQRAVPSDGRGPVSSMRCPSCGFVAPGIRREPIVWLQTHGPGGTRCTEFGGVAVTAGRGAHNRVRLDDDTVSGTHVLLTPVPAALGIEFHDLGSKNGCFVNGERLSRGALGEGDELAVGPYRMAVGNSVRAAASPGESTRVRPVESLLSDGSLASQVLDLPPLEAGTLHLLGVSPRAVPLTGSEGRARWFLEATASCREVRRHVRAFGGKLLAEPAPCVLACWEGLQLLEALDCARSILSSLAGTQASMAVWSGAGAVWDFGQDEGELTSPNPEALLGLREQMSRVPSPGRLVLGGLACHAHSWFRGCVDTSEDVPELGRVRILHLEGRGRASDGRPNILSARLSLPGGSGSSPGLLLPLRRLGRGWSFLALLRGEACLALATRLDAELADGQGTVSLCASTARKQSLAGLPWTLVDGSVAGDLPCGGRQEALAPDGDLYVEVCPVCAAAYDAREAAPGSVVLCGRCWSSFRARPEEFEESRGSRSGATAAVEALACKEGVPALPGYRIVRELGKGGMGRVFEAVREEDGLRVAVKEILPEFQSNVVAVQRFRREGHVLTSLTHPNIVQVVETMMTARMAFIALEFVDGVSLEVWRRKRWPAPPEAAFVALEVAKALACCHAKGILHRDVTPANILLARSGQVKLTDFGLAVMLGGTRYTKSGMALGTESYRPQEMRFDAKNADARADLYSLGMVLYELLARKLPANAPFPAPSEVEDSAPRGLDAVVLKALEFERDERWPDVEPFARELSRALEGEGLTARFPAEGE